TALSLLFFYSHLDHRDLPSFPTRRSSDLSVTTTWAPSAASLTAAARPMPLAPPVTSAMRRASSRSGGASVSLYSSSGQYSMSKRSEEHTSELQSLTNLVCRLLLEKQHTID